MECLVLIHSNGRTLMVLGRNPTQTLRIYKCNLFHPVSHRVPAALPHNMYILPVWVKLGLSQRWTSQEWSCNDVEAAIALFRPFVLAQKMIKSWALLILRFPIISTIFNPCASYESHAAFHYKHSMIKHSVHAHIFHAFIFTMSIRNILMLYVYAETFGIFTYIYTRVTNWLLKGPDNRWYNNYLSLVGRSKPPST